jgi:GNAT superfamily N-acetyltransferase
VSAELKIRAADGAADMDVTREMFREYQEWLGVDLCFQGFDAELAGLPGEYAPPKGRLYLVFDGESGKPAACVGLRPLRTERSEMKRLYVREPWRGRGLGRELAMLCVEQAQNCGYRYLCLDTLPKLKAARALYLSMGFRDIDAYYDNPLDGVSYMQLDL